jgi:ubiquinone/menaquinone biosynthesis C-methylase UbiE
LKLVGKNSLSCCGCLAEYPIRQGIPVLIPDISNDVQLSHNKWDDEYERELRSGDYERKYTEYISKNYSDTYRQINTKKPLDKHITYLEIGCGNFFFGQSVAKKCGLIIGIDFSFNALLIAKKMLEKKGIKKFLLIQGDILKMPIKKDTIDLIYGGGVIEHFKDTQNCVNELYRVLRPGGVSFNTVPYLNVGSIYRQAWGNIPNVPVLREAAETVHIKLLGGRHMRFGYEFSFLASTLRKIHRRAGFKTVEIDKFDVELCMEFIPHSLHKHIEFLAKNSRHFWPMVKVVASK